MCFWLPLGQTDRNTCLVSVTNLIFYFIIFLYSYNGFRTDLVKFYRFWTILTTKKVVKLKKLSCSRGGGTF
jgi:hypothetical protein